MSLTRTPHSATDAASWSALSPNYVPCRMSKQLTQTVQELLNTVAQIGRSDAPAYFPETVLTRW